MPGEKTPKTEKSLGKKSAIKKKKKYRKEIKFAAKIFGIDSNGIASVIFQEKYHGIFADLKDLITFLGDDLMSTILDGEKGDVKDKINCAI